MASLIAVYIAAFTELGVVSCKRKQTKGSDKPKLPLGTEVLDPMKNMLCFCDLSVREKDWRAASQVFERMHNTLSQRVKTQVPSRVLKGNNSNRQYTMRKLR